MKKIFLYILFITAFFYSERIQAQIFSVAPGTQMNIEAGTIFNAENITLTPTTKISLTGINLNVNNTVSKTLTNNYISRVYNFSANTPAFTGAIQMQYNDGIELKNIAEPNLKLFINNGTTWQSYSNSIDDALNNIVSTSNIAGVTLKEITLGCMTPQVPTATGAIICAGNTAILKAVGIGTLSWYSAATGGYYLGSGTSFTTPILSASKTYYVQDSTCSASTRLAVTASVNLSPTLFNVTGGGSFCVGGSGVTVGLSNSQTGVNYQLKLEGTNIGAPISGTTKAISFGNQLSAGLYSVIATNATGCSISMSNTVIVNINSIPAINPSLINQTICTGVSIATIGIPDTKNSLGTTYSWSRTNTTSLTGVAASGTTLPISGILNNTTTIPQNTVFTFKAISLAGCSFSTTATVTINPKPTITQQPSNTSKTIAQTASFSVIATGLVTSYQWQVSVNGGVTWTNITNAGLYSGANSSTIYITGVTIGMTNYKYRCIATGQCDPPIVSNAATLTVTKSSNNIITSIGILTMDAISISESIPATVLAFPNPTSGNVNIALENFNIGSVIIKIVDSKGILVKIKEVTVSSKKEVVMMDISSLINGVYYIQVIQSNQVKLVTVIKN